MSNTTFTNFTTPAIDAGWLNDVNNLVYNLAGNGTNAPTNDSDIRTNIGLGTMATQNSNNVTITGGSVANVTQTDSTITGGSISALATDLAIADGGTGASTAAAARTNLSVPQIGPAFSANLVANQALTSGVAAIVIFTSEDYDTSSYYNNATGVFTPLVAGYYQFSWDVIADGQGNPIINSSASLFKNGVEYQRGSQLIVPAGAAAQFYGSAGSVLVFMNGTTDFVDIRTIVSTSAGNPRVASTSSNRFTGVFIRP